MTDWVMGRNFWILLVLFIFRGYLEVRSVLPQAERGLDRIEDYRWTYCEGRCQVILMTTS